MKLIRMFKIATRELAHEFATLKEKERKAEEGKLQRLRRLEKEAMTLANELAQMQKAQKERESDKIAQIVEHEKEARRIAGQLVATYETDRKCKIILRILANNTKLKIKLSGGRGTSKD